MTTTTYKSEAAAFGTRDDWSTWKGTEIGNRIVNFFNYKIYNVFGDSLPSTPSTSKIQAYFFSSTPKERQSKQKGSLVSSNNVTEDSDDTEGSDDAGDEIESGREVSEETRAQFADMAEFYSYSQPPITFNDYVKRLIHYTRMSISPVNLAVALFYIERIEKKGVCEVNQFTIFRLLAVAYLVAYKYMDDPPMMKNLEYCKIAGISLAELNRLEFSFLKAMDFELGIGDDVSVAQKITRILVPPKVSPEILIGNKTQHSTASQCAWLPPSSFRCFTFSLSQSATSDAVIYSISTCLS
jgi:hypothetical protein